VKYLSPGFPLFCSRHSSGLLVPPPLSDRPTIVIENGDAAGVGFNDPTVVAPVGGNGGTTLGQQRLLLFRPPRISGRHDFKHAEHHNSCDLVIQFDLHDKFRSTRLCRNAGNIYRDFSGSVPGFWYGKRARECDVRFDRKGRAGDKCDLQSQSGHQQLFD